jgi:hypothetical protein
MDDFFNAHKTANNEHSIVNALAACVSTSMLTSGPSTFDHRHMFQVPAEESGTASAFIASPFLPANWRSNRAFEYFGVCTSGIASSVASTFLRTTFSAGLSFLNRVAHCLPVLANESDST